LECLCPSCSANSDRIAVRSTLQAKFPLLLNPLESAEQNDHAELGKVRNAMEKKLRGQVVNPRFDFWLKIKRNWLNFRDLSPKSRASVTLKARYILIFAELIKLSISVSAHSAG
jgi:hypothetical protein